MLESKVSQLGPSSNGDETSFDRVREKAPYKGRNCSALTETTLLNQITVPVLDITWLTLEAMMQPVEKITPHYLRRQLHRMETFYQSWPLMLEIIIVKIWQIKRRQIY